MSIKTYSEYEKQDLLDLTKAIMAYLDGWKLSNEQVLAVLGLTEIAKTRHINSYRAGEKVFPETDDLLVRIDHIIGIADALRTTFPFSDSMRYTWLRKAHRRFKKNTPLAVILADDSPNGLMKVRIEVDCSYGYTISEAMRTQKPDV